MFFHDKTYDLDELIRHNMHIHTTFSRCAKPEMKVKAIVEEAEKSGLELIALTDHSSIYFHDDVYKHNPKLKKELSKIETDVKVLFGGELSCYGIGKFARDIKCDNSLDYRLYTTNHYHQDYWEHPAEKTPRGYAVHMLELFDCVIESGRADCFAHPFTTGYIKAVENKTDITASITDSELFDIMKKANEREIAWELNVGAVFGDPVFYRRFFNIGKEAGVIFNIGTDAHRLCNIDTKQYLAQLKSILY